MQIRCSVGRRGWTVAAGAIAVSLALAGCGGSKSGGAAQGVTSSQRPEQAVQAAVSNLARQSDVKMVLSLGVTAAQAKQLSAKGGGKPMTDAEADALSQGSVFFNLATADGQPLDSAAAQKESHYAVDVGLTIHGNTPLEVIYTGGNLYARAELQQLLTDVGQNPAKASQFTQELSGLDKYVPGISALAQGQWAEIDHQGLASLAPLLKQMGGSATNSAPLKADITTLRSQLLAALQADSTFSSERGNRYTMTVEVGRLLATIQPELHAALANVPQLGTQIDNALSKMESKVPPGQTAVVDLSTSDGKLSQAQVDLNQFAGKNQVNFRVPLQVAFSSPGAPTAPTGATTLDVSKLPALLGALLGNKSAA